jgi:hypothetical protein
MEGNGEPGPLGKERQTKAQGSGKIHIAEPTRREQETGGWSPAGKERYNALVQEVKTNRKDRAGWDDDYKKARLDERNALRKGRENDMVIEVNGPAVITVFCFE